MMDVHKLSTPSSRLMEAHRAHLARRGRLWLAEPLPKPERAMPEVETIEPALIPEPTIDERMTELADLQKQAEAIRSNVAAILDSVEAQMRQAQVALIVQTVCTYYHIRIRDMMARRRPRNIVVPRQIAMYLARELTAQSLPEIGRRFDKRDHTTVLHAINKIEKLRKTDAGLDAQIVDLTTLLTAREG